MTLEPSVPFDINDSPRAERTSNFDKSTRELASKMNCDQSTIVRHF